MKPKQEKTPKPKNTQPKGRLVGAGAGFLFCTLLLFAPIVGSLFHRSNSSHRDIPKALEPDWIGQLQYMVSDAKGQYRSALDQEQKLFEQSAREGTSPEARIADAALAKDTKKKTYPNVLPVAQILFQALRSVHLQLPSSPHLSNNLQSLSLQMAALLPICTKFYERVDQNSRFFIAYGPQHVIVVDLDAKNRITMTQVIALGDTRAAYQAAKLSITSQWRGTPYDLAVLCDTDQGGKAGIITVPYNSIKPMGQAISASDFLDLQSSRPTVENK